MRPVKVLIPTCQSGSTVYPLQAEISANTLGAETFASCLDASASVNRNKCLDRLEIGDTAIMVDSDISGFYPGWADDLLKGLEMPGAVVVSARLLNPDGSFGPTCSRCYEPEPAEIEVHWNGHCVLPTAAIAFVHRGHRFCERMLGSGWEDNLWCANYMHADPGARFYQSNRCRLVHANHRTAQEENWSHNKRVFFEELSNMK